MRLPRDRITKTSEKILSVGEMLIFMMDNAKIAADGSTRLLIDYETLTLIEK
ncbi:hypothetical protein [Shinella zoogloeoides]|uniref:hypothetical protein n=1 Tax=Shinella zoogloeoides TaxID=352475 RepID=UPI00299DD4BF|nr:hypothetical protein [Shinella zoogloeoides]